MKVTTKQEETTRKEMKEAFALWRNESEKGSFYLKGYTEDKQTKLIGFFNTNKKNPNEPDVRVYVHKDGKKDIEVASLWENISEEKGTRYLTGTTNENEKLTAFYGKENENARPYIRAYYKEN